MRPLSFYCSSCFKDPKETAYSQHNFYIGIRDQQNNNNNVQENREVMIRVPVFFLLFGKDCVLKCTNMNVFCPTHATRDLLCIF